MTKKRIVSGMRATGSLHIGNFHGTLSLWKSLHDIHECFFFIADLHALTTNYDKTDQIITNVESIMLDWLSAGLDPNKSTLFIQSLVPEHTELYLFLSMVTPMSWLERNPTCKDQIKQLDNKNLATHGFLGYPVLQAADILIYKANLVPVGIDQIPHVEITREIARRFNHFYGETFPEPLEILTKFPKILGIDCRKMSKSYDNAIFLSDSPKNILRKVSKMFTDPQRKKKTDPGNPEICNVFEFHKLYSRKIKHHYPKLIRDMCTAAKIGCVECKKTLGENLVRYFSPFQEKRKQLKENKQLLREIFQDGSKKAQTIAQETIAEVKDRIKIKI